MMNPNLEKLCNKSFEWAYEQNHEKSSLFYIMVEKLCELIVNECVEICEQGEETQTTSRGAAQLIRLHFGIKEKSENE